MKAIRSIIFIPMIFVIVTLVYTLLPLSLIGLLSLNNFWVFILLFFFGGSAFGIFALLPGYLTWLAAKISPNKKFAFYSIFSISVLLGISQIYNYWTNPFITDNELGVFLCILLTCLTIGFSISLTVGAGIKMFEEKKTLYENILSIGTYIFIIGIFLVFCLLSNKICNIIPNKTYTWSSGIWHGLFGIPNWILSWFSDNTYYKAPNSTTAYSIWWWISFIFVVLNILGGSRRNSSYY